MKKLFIQETHIDATDEQHRNCFHVSDITETDFTSLSDLYRFLRREHSGKITKIFVDAENGDAIHVGYTVTKTSLTDEGDEFLEEIWIELLEPVQVVETVIKYKPVGA